MFRVNFKVSIRLRVKLDYIRLDSVRLKLVLTRLTSGVYIHLYVDGCQITVDSDSAI